MDHRSSTTANHLQDTAMLIFSAAIKAVDPEECVNRWLRLNNTDLLIGQDAYPLAANGKLYLIGIGKAAAAMAHATETLFGDRINDGVIITKYGHGMALKHCRLLEAGHPVPDDNGVEATTALLDLVATATRDDLILCLISGGGSALCPAPAAGITLADKQATTRQLLASGATIHEINTIRKHLSRIKGGRLTRATNGARLVSLILSDVIGNDLDIIASGITAPDPSTFGDCLAILGHYQLLDMIPEAVKHHLKAGTEGLQEETPKPGDPVFVKIRNYMVGSIADALAAAAVKAEELGFHPLILTSTLQGEAREAAKVLAGIAIESRRSGQPVPPPTCMLAGGETTVTLRGQGLGGRNMEFALAGAMALAGTRDTLLLSAGTDGTDGPTDAAGAFADGTTATRAGALKMSLTQHLADNNSYRFFLPLGDLFITGPTRTNVMDIVIFLIDV
ncbi:MAG: glycerate kinase [Proteobacteria bacterium]|nr:glycerate kinase [Pseudomonadota bacterium]